MKGLRRLASTRSPGPVFGEHTCCSVVEAMMRPSLQWRFGHHAAPACRNWRAAFVASCVCSCVQTRIAVAPMKHGVFARWASSAIGIFKTGSGLAPVHVEIWHGRSLSRKFCALHQELCAYLFSQVSPLKAGGRIRISLTRFEAGLLQHVDDVNAVAGRV